MENFTIFRHEKQRETCLSSFEIDKSETFRKRLWQTEAFRQLIFHLRALFLKDKPLESETYLSPLNVFF